MVNGTIYKNLHHLLTTLREKFKFNVMNSRCACKWFLCTLNKAIYLGNHVIDCWIVVLIENYRSDTSRVDLTNIRSASIQLRLFISSASRLYCLTMSYGDDDDCEEDDP